MPFSAFPGYFSRSHHTMFVRSGPSLFAYIGTAEQGEPGEGAAGFAGCDLIAMSTHGRGGLERWVMGSVTERVLGATKLPMLIVRPQKKG